MNFCISFSSIAKFVTIKKTMDNNTVPVSKLHVPCWHLRHGSQPLPQCNGIQSLQFAPVYLYAHVHTSGRTHNPWPLQLFTVLQHDKVIYNCKCNFEYPLINPFRFLALKYFFSYLVFQSFDYEHTRWRLFKISSFFKMLNVHKWGRLHTGASQEKRKEASSIL